MLTIGEQVRREEFRRGEDRDQEASLLAADPADQDKDYRLIAEARKRAFDESYVWTVHRVPRILRMSCSVAVDSCVRGEQLERVMRLVAGAVGINEARGDLLAVESIPIARRAAVVADDPPPNEEPVGYPALLAVALVPAGVLLLVLAAFGSSRRSSRARTETRMAPGSGTRSILDLLGDRAGTTRAPAPTEINPCERLESLARTAPEHAVAVLKNTWLN
ncbi:MAG: hypothetical protein HY319_30085 [Armatimonadetes bacterium]|nr:hypothetical protein [Armatimonadota bacterium]